jgi:1,4-alpha-glucan branching enzyme
MKKGTMSKDKNAKKPASQAISPATGSIRARNKPDHPGIENGVWQELQKVAEGRHHDPFSVLGRHRVKDSEIVRIYMPDVREVYLVDLDVAMNRVPGTDFFTWQGEPGQLSERYRIEWYDNNGTQHLGLDPYSFAPQLSDFDLHLFGEGKHWHAYRLLGAHATTVNQVPGVLFAVWAPNAERISVVGEFNQWDGRRHPMRNRGGSGVWELFLPELHAGTMYKYEIRSKHGQVFLKSDPYGQGFEYRPRTASVVVDKTPFLWQDEEWVAQRKSGAWLHQPLSIYEVHLGSWRRDQNGRFLSYGEIAHRLVDYVKDMGFTHIELLPVTEHPLDASWGYQTTGYFAPTSRFGAPDDFRYFVNHCHRNGIGVIMDWAPAHFPKDSHGLAFFDGGALYEHEDPRRGEHRDWGTLIYNYERNEVRNFLLSSAVFWMEEFHIDGLRVDAVASMLYLDYSRQAGDWVPNRYGGNENLGAVDFLRQLNSVAHGQYPGCLIIAEESTSWPQVTRPTYIGGLGFSMKWNMGWMHDTLHYMQQDPVFRRYHHDKLTFGLMYAFSENFVLPFSHDEVVHGKGSMLNKMPGDDWQRFANLRTLYTLMFTYPGKKLLFMGSEFAQPAEWNFDSQLQWELLESPNHSGVQRLLKDLNSLYRQHSALHYFDFTPEGFDWIDCHDADQSIITYIRKHGDTFLIVVCNFTPVPRHDYRIGVPQPGSYREVLNSDSAYYGGTNVGNLGEITTEDTPWMNQPASLILTVPPLAGIVLQHHNSSALPPP